jgi:Ankyrin repeats (3 copies)
LNQRGAPLSRSNSRVGSARSLAAAAAAATAAAGLDRGSSRNLNRAMSMSQRLKAEKRQKKKKRRGPGAGDDDDDMKVVLSNKQKKLFRYLEVGNAKLGKIRTLLSGGYFTKGVDIEVRDEDGRTPLMIACAYGHEDVVKMLLELGAEVNCQDRSGGTPLIHAVVNNRTLIARMLLHFGVNVNIQDDVSFTVYCLCFPHQSINQCHVKHLCNVMALCIVCISPFFWLLASCFVWPLSDILILLTNQNCSIITQLLPLPGLVETTVWWFCAFICLCPRYLGDCSKTHCRASRCECTGQ